MQFFATALSDVCYRLHGRILGPHRRNGINARHHLQDLFERRIVKGQCFRTPCLGWSEFTCSYWGAFRDGVTEVDDAMHLDVPSMLLGVWNCPTRGHYQPQFCQNARIIAGRLKYELPTKWLGEAMSEEVPDAK